MLKLYRRDNSVALATREANLRPGTYNAEAGTVDAVIATGSPVHRNGYVEILDVGAADLSVLRGAPVLNNHRQGSVDDVLGSVVDHRREGDTIVATLRLSDRPEHASIVSAIRSGTLASVSIGYEVSQWEDGTDANGARTRTAKAWRIREVSFVAVPADPHARTRNAVATIIERCRSVGLDQPFIDGLLTRNATLDQANEAIVNELRTRSGSIRSTHNEHTLDNRENFVRAAGEALYTRIDPSHQPSGAARQFVGMTMPDLMREVLRRNGVSTMGLSAGSLYERAGLMSTSDFPQILANTTGRVMRAAYNRPSSGIRTLARATTNPDFRPKSNLVIDTGDTLEKIGEHGEFKAGKLVEAGESFKLDTFGRKYGITRQAIVNDDLGAFNFGRFLGLAAQNFESQYLVNLLQSNSGVGPNMADGNPLHHTSHANVSASGAAPAENTLSAGRLAMRKQTGPGGSLITVTPRFLLIPSELETASEKLLTAIQAAQTSDVNPFSKLSLVVEPRLTSATRWWLVATDVDGLEYGHLEGEPGPQIATQIGFDVDGIEYRVRLDYGAGWADFRGWYTNAGA